MLNEPIVPASAERLDALENAGPLQLAEPLRVIVYNLTVDEFHTYYVADLGVWVHNTYGGPEAVAIVSRIAEINEQCFHPETSVMVRPTEETWHLLKGCVRLHKEDALDQIVPCEIQFIKPGVEVLSRCEKTGEVGFKRVREVFKHISPTDNDEDCYQLRRISYVYPNRMQEYPNNSQWGIGDIWVTDGHRFWVEGKGWVPARDIKKGDVFLSHNSEGGGELVLALGTGLRDISNIVYNLSVEDFNTYFVGHGIWVHNTKLKPAHTEFLPEIAPQAKPTEGKFPSLPNEQPARDWLAQRGLDTGVLPAGRKGVNSENTLGKSYFDINDGVTRQGDPDVVIKRTSNASSVSDSLAWLHGTVADLFRPEGSNQFSIANTIRDKSHQQASVVIVDLRDPNCNVQAKDIANALDNLRAKPEWGFEAGVPKGLQAVVFIEKDNSGYVRRFAETPENKITYGQVYLESGKNMPIQGITGAPSPETPIYLDGKGYIEVALVGQMLGVTLDASSSLDAVSVTARQYWLNAGASEAALADVQINIDELPTRVAAQTVGNQITLSADGAGWGWFVDTTPGAQEEFGLGNSLTAFNATSGSVAEGKLDLLTVLVHELGHVLGLAHTGESTSTAADADVHDHADAQNDVMAQFIAPGVRRIPNAHDAALLVQQGAHRPASGNGAAIVVYTSTVAQPPQQALLRSAYLTAINPTLTNGNFATGQNGSSSGTVSQWETTGKVDATPSTITLGESTTAQAHLAQAFIITPQDRFLSFTVSGLSLQTNSIQQNGILTAAPQDAFEVALTNANTGSNLLSSLATDHSDALLNIQLASSDPTSALQERSAAGLRHTDNADGSRTYLLDLSAIFSSMAAVNSSNTSAGVAVSLSFDLIGFGMTPAQPGSQVSITPPAPAAWCS